MARARIELTFDYESESMINVTKFSYVVMVCFAGFLVIQLIILLYKNVGLLTFWIFLEYSQLVAFLPL